MVFYVIYVKGLSTELKEKYGERLHCLKGAIGVLEEIARESKESGNGFRGKFVWDSDFNCLYNHVLGFIIQEESSTGYSVYRKMLKKVDKELSEILSERRRNLIPRQKKKILSMAGVE